MSSSEQESQDDLHVEEDYEQPQQAEEEVFPAETAASAEEEQSGIEEEPAKGVGRGRFVHGLLVGLGIGSLASFVMTWLTVYFTPQLPIGVTYENLLTVFIYPMVYLLGVGLVALTAGVVKEYFTRRK